ncbi:MAG TPA: pyruvate kinase [Candidatus Avimonoglobus intestinipullorum]|uniref:Pyruvate kinase n=1 Tax=Candidatus Avimonoglobus intestinipullorum TaxID=2840699 RepID=A0A9D1LVH8_9FIRM|nr:pyruvate kinase [Candidatus Avimonoglobus intestinipullorum]
MRKTKIICTMGPASDDDTVLRNLMLAGMDVARINFSHGTHEEALEKMERIKRIREELDLPVAILLDTKGPEIRLKQFKGGKAFLKAGDQFTLHTDDVEGDDTKVSITYKNLPKEIKAGTRLLIDDGLIELEAVSVKGTKIICEVKSGGPVSDSKGVNVPNVSLKMPYMSQKDIDDILFGIEQDVDFVAASFVRTQEDVLEIRKLLDKNGGKNIRIIAKIENSEGVENIDEILKASNGVMVARGDMGVEIPLELLPVIQKRIIKKTYRAGKVVITATQMLDSMIRNPRPTRAEVTDVANAIYDGTSAIMLSGETAIGKYPVEAVKTMSGIAERTERDIDYKKRLKNMEFDLENMDVTNALSHATCTTAHDLDASAVIALTYSGGTAHMVSKFRPACPIIAPTVSEKVRRQLNLSWGVVPIMSQKRDNTDELFDHAVECALQAHLVQNGDLVVLTGGAPMGMSGTTNIMKVHLVGHILVSGTGINNQKTTAEVFVAKNQENLKNNFKAGSIVVLSETDKSMVPYLKKAGGIICEEEGEANNAAIIGLTLDIPVITGAKGATQILKTGTVVTMDANEGRVYSGMEG